MNYPCIQTIHDFQSKLKDLFDKIKVLQVQLICMQEIHSFKCTKIYNEGPNLPNYTFNVPWQVSDEIYPSFPSPYVLKFPLKVYTSSLQVLYLCELV